MSCIIDLDPLSFKDRKKILNDLTVESLETNYGKKENICTFDTIQTDEKKYKLVVPFSYHYHHLTKTFPNDNIEFSRTNDYEFVGKLNGIQEEVKPEAYEILNRTRSILISLACGMGKTIFSIFLASRLKYKMCVLAHRINIIDQWVYSINKVCPKAVVQVILPKTKINHDADFYVMNVTSVQKRSREDFKDIGILCVDECHTICTDSLSKSLYNFSPKYTIGLSATLQRTDKMDRILELYFGPEIIERKLYRSFNTYLYKTGIKIKTEQNKMGKLDWNKVLEAQCLNEDRNDLIVNIIRFFSNRNILVLCKRVDQSKILLKKLQKLGESVTHFVSSHKVFDIESRVLISTYSKCGVGFSFDKLDMLIIASDVAEGIEQYVGRVFRREDVAPIIIDLVDNLHTLYKHYLTRKALYERIGTIVKDFNKCFPEFEEDNYLSL